MPPSNLTPQERDAALKMITDRAMNLISRLAEAQQRSQEEANQVLAAAEADELICLESLMTTRLASLLIDFTESGKLDMPAYSALVHSIAQIFTELEARMKRFGGSLPKDELPTWTRELGEKLEGRRGPQH